jgi:hypothetical protein
MQKGFRNDRETSGNPSARLVNADAGARKLLLNEGQHIEYEIEENRGKTSAVNLKVK